VGLAKTEASAKKDPGRRQVYNWKFATVFPNLESLVPGFFRRVRLLFIVFLGVFGFAPGRPLITHHHQFLDLQLNLPPFARSGVGLGLSRTQLDQWLKSGTGFQPVKCSAAGANP
jgi:hypothetical protein